MFGERVGYQSLPWAGAFIDVVAREAGLNLPSFTYSPAALAEFIRSGRIVIKPRPGDIAIFNFASTAASAFSSPHCGIVTDVRELRTNGTFVTIEGDTFGSGQFQDKNGVYQRIRHLTDVVLFCRPEEFDRNAAARIIQLLIKFRKKLTGGAPGKLELAQLKEAATNNETVRSKMLRGNTRNKSIELVQLALSQVTDIQGAERGKWDSSTAAAFARFQRNIGRVGSDAQGIPDTATLNRLSKETGLFKLDE